MTLPVTPPQVFGYGVQQAPEPEFISLRDVIDFLKGNCLVIGACVVVVMVLGAAYAITTPPTYTAEARLIIDTSQSRLVLQEPETSSLAFESARVDSEVELVKSRSIALAVIERLELVNEREYNDEPGLLTRARRWVKSALDDTPSIEGDEVDARLRRAMGAYTSRLGVRRLGQSYILEISYSSARAARAAEITNAVVDAYIEAKVESKADAARRGAAWLEVRLNELGRQANRAAASVEQFKAAQNIVISTTDGSLVERQLRDTSTQLLQARGETNRLKARLDAVDAMLASGDLTDVPAADIAGNTILTTLRQRMIDADVRQAEIVSRYGPTGAVPDAASREIDQIRSAISAELLRIRAVYRVDLDAAELNQSNTGGSFEDMLGTAAESSGQYVRLAELESQASTYRRMYETMLQQFTQTVQRQSFPVSDARVVTPAVQPFTPSEPKTTLIMALSLVSGSALGLGVAIGRNALRTSVTSVRQVETRAGVPCLAVLPRRGRISRLWSRLAGDRGRAARELRSVLDAPFSDFSRALSSAKVSLDLAAHQKRPLLLGVASVRREGASSRIASNLAFLYAAEGVSTLLVDGAVQAAVLTARLAPDAPSCQLADDERPPLPEFEHGLRFASIAAEKDGDTIPYRTLSRLKSCLQAAVTRYEVVIVDLPPVRDASDARALSPMLDGILIICEHRRTPLADLAAAVASFSATDTRLRAVIVDSASGRASHG